MTLRGDRRMIFAAIVLAWACLVGLGIRILLTYENTPGAPAKSAARWPSNSALVRPAGKFVLVIFAHPDCPCTRASLTELEVLMTQLQGKLVAFIEFRKPGASQAEAQDSTLWRRAFAIPGVSVGFDRDGSEVDKFGAEVSGQTLLYDQAGQLVFSGGITAARGHEGENSGVDAILLRVAGGAAPFHAPVFGCSLRDPDSQTLNKDTSWKKP